MRWIYYTRKHTQTTTMFIPPFKCFLRPHTDCVRDFNKIAFLEGTIRCHFEPFNSAIA